MSQTLTVIRTDFLAARKAKDKFATAFFSTLIGEIESNAVIVNGTKTVSEDAVIATLKSFEKKGKEILAIEGIDASFAELTKADLARTVSYLPLQLDAKEIHKVFLNAPMLEGAKMGDYMKYLKDNYAGQYDGKIAAQVVKEFV